MEAELASRLDISRTGPVRLRADRGWYLPAQGTLAILDSDFGTVREFELGADVSSFAVSPDLTRVAVARQARISLIGDGGETLWSVEHAPWGTATPPRVTPSDGRRTAMPTNRGNPWGGRCGVSLRRHSGAWRPPAVPAFAA